MADGEAGEGRANLYQPAEAAVFWALVGREADTRAQPSPAISTMGRTRWR